MAKPLFEKILIANRGEITCRIIGTLKKLGICSVAIYSDADANALHRELADEAYPLGASESSASYLNIKKILSIAKQAKVDAIHPGYGFLSENADFAEACKKAKITFIGPRPETIRLLGNKLKAKSLATKLKIPLVPHFKAAPDRKGNYDERAICDFASSVGYPIVIKAASGGGGRGMRRVDNAQDIHTALQSAAREALAFFSSSEIFIEKYIGTKAAPARHIEVQILGDTFGNVRHLYDRDCSLQRHHQKVIEEAPAPNLSAELRTKLHKAATSLTKAVGYTNAGTVEFLVEGNSRFYLLEVNSRLQVEHPVTEMITGLDLVALQIRISAGESVKDLFTLPALSECGHAIEARICSEIPEQGFIASTGTLRAFSIPQESSAELQAQGIRLRLDSGFRQADNVSHYYDSLLAKLCAHGKNRESTLTALTASLANSQVFGVSNNIPFLIALLGTPEVTTAKAEIHFIDSWINAANQNAARDTLLAAFTALLPWRNYQPDDAWSNSDGFRVYAASKSYAAALVGTTETPVTLTNLSDGQWQAQSKQSTVEFSLLIRGPNNAQVIVRNDSLTPAEFSVQFTAFDSGVSLSTPWGTFLTFERPAPGPIKAKKSGEKSDIPPLLAPLPGKIVSLQVKEKDRVKSGQQLAVIESMKMEHILRAPQNLTIDSLKVKEGDIVTAGSVLIYFSHNPVE